MRHDKSRTVLITGAAGLIGVHVVRRVRCRGWRVVAFDDGSSGTLGRLTEFSDDPMTELVVADIRDENALRQVIASERPWAVFHLAARHFIPDCERQPGETLDVNVMGTQLLIDACAARPPERIVFASTADVYGGSEEPHRETDPLSPVGVYGCSKLLGEHLFRDQAKRLPGCAVSIARLFNVYGPGDPHPHLLPEIVSQLSRGSSLRLGDLNSARDYIYVDDVARALLAIAESGETGVFNVGTGTSSTGNKLVEIAAGVLGRDPDVQFDAARLRSHERRHSCADISHIAERVAWSPRVAIAAGVRQTIEARSREYRSALP